MSRENQSITWDHLVKYIPLITAVVSVAGFLVGIHRFNITRENEFKKYFWEKQLDYYMDASRSAAKLATIGDKNARSAVYQEFLELYHGPMVIFEDEPVKEP
jgi:hypothetical protein